MTPAGSGMRFSKEVIIVHMPTYITSHYPSITLTDYHSELDPLILTSAENWHRLVSNLKSRLTETELAEIFDDTLFGHFVYIADSPDADHQTHRFTATNPVIRT